MGSESPSLSRNASDYAGVSPLYAPPDSPHGQFLGGGETFGRDRPTGEVAQLFFWPFRSLGISKPNQMMRNFISRELPRGKIPAPSYAPYIAGAVSAAPWPFPVAGNSLAIAKRSTNRQAEKEDRPPKTCFPRLAYV